VKRLERAEAWLTIRFKNSKIAKAVAKAVSPDNATAPKDLTVETISKGKKVYCKVVCFKSAETFLATLDDLLSSISMAERMIKEAEK
jgi:hypothetical protein